MTKITKSEKKIREGLIKWKNFLNEGAFKPQVQEGVEPREGDDVKIIGGALTGAEGEVMELTTTTQGHPAVVVYLRKDADMRVYGAAGDEVIVQPKFVEVDRGIQAGLSEARMGEYGKIDAEDGNPPSKIGRGNEEYMAAYNAVLQARGEEPLDIQKPDQAYLDALRSGQLEEGGAEFKVGDEVIANGRNGTITDLSIPGMATVDLGRQGETTVSLSDIEHRFYKGDFGMELYDIDENITDVKVGDKVKIIGGAVVGAYGEVIELTTTGGIGVEGGLPAFVVKLEGDADKRIYGAAGDEVIIQPKFVQKMRMADPDVMYGSDDEREDLEEGAGHDESLAQAQNQGVAFIRGQDDKAETIKQFSG